MKSAIISFDLKRFAGIKRDYTKEDVEKLKGTFNIEHSLSKSQSEKLWNLLNTEPYVNTLGSLSGNQAVQHAKAGLKAIYLSGWQVAADANSDGEMYPDQSLYPYDSAPKLVDVDDNDVSMCCCWSISGGIFNFGERKISLVRNNSMSSFPSMFICCIC